MSQVWEVALPAFDKLVLLALADCANDEGLAWPSIATLKRKTGASERTIYRAIAGMESLGVLTMERVIGKGNRYHITPAAVAPLPDRHPCQRGSTPLPDRQKTPATVAPKPSKNHQEPSEVESADADDFSFSDFVESWNEAATRHGLPRIVRPGDRLKRAFRARKREYPEIEHWRNAFRCLERTDWLHGKNDRGWRADSDFFLQPKSFTKLVEGSYGQTH
jgi:hypothetical protein